MELFDRVLDKLRATIQQLLNIKTRKLLAIGLPIILVFVVLLTPMISFAFSLNPFDYFLSMAAAICINIANVLYGFGYAILSLGMLFSKLLITDSMSSPIMADLNNNVNVIAYSVFGVTLLLTIVATTLGVNNKDWAANTMIPKLALTVFLMIFSRPIAAVIYDLGSVLTNTINPDWWNTAMSTTAWTKALQGGGMNIITAILALIVAIVALIIMIIGFVILIFRAVIIMLLIILAPLAFAMNVLPWTKSVYTQWWSNFTKWVFYLPIFVLIMKIGQIVTNMSASPNPALANFINTNLITPLNSLPLPAAGAATSLGIVFTTSFWTTLLDPSGYLMLFAGLIITAAALFYPLSLMGGIAASVGKSAQNATTKKAAELGKTAGGSLTKSAGRAIGNKMGSEGKPFGETANKLMKGDEMAQSKNPVIRALGETVQKATKSDPEATYAREEADGKAVERLKLNANGSMTMEKRLAKYTKKGADGKPGMSHDAAVEKILTEFEEEMLSGKASDSYYEDIPFTLVQGKGADKVVQDKLKQRTVIAKGKTHELGGARTLAAARSQNGANFKVNRAKTAAQYLASGEGADGEAFTMGDFTSTNKGIGELGAEELAKTSFDKITTDMLTAKDAAGKYTITTADLQKYVDIIDGQQEYLNKSGSVSRESKVAMDEARKELKTRTGGGTTGGTGGGGTTGGSGGTTTPTP